MSQHMWIFVLLLYIYVGKYLLSVYISLLRAFERFAQSVDSEALPMDR